MSPREQSRTASKKPGRTASKRCRAGFLSLILLLQACSAAGSVDLGDARAAIEQPGAVDQDTAPDDSDDVVAAAPSTAPTAPTTTTTVVVAAPSNADAGVFGTIDDEGDEGAEATDQESNRSLAIDGQPDGATVEERLDCVAPSSEVTEQAPAWVVNALDAAVNHPDFAQLDVSVSVWIDGWGEVITRDPDLRLVPASNEKILVAHAANELLDPSSTFDTIIERVGTDLVLRASGDPTFSTERARNLVDQVAASGITSADRLIIDVSDFPQPSAATGWESWQIRNFVGPLSGLMLDGNRWNTSDEFLETPALLNGEWMADALRLAGVSVGSVEVGTSPTGRTVGTVSSAPVGALVRDMMLFSNNQIADMTVLQLGLIEGQGTLVDGIAQIDDVLADLCVPLSGIMDDGSGLSRSNLRSAREFQEILRGIRASDTADVFEEQLPIGGVNGTLRNRFGGDAGRVLAKTGTIFGGRALSGYATTDSGRDVVFSILINGDRETTSSSLGAMDALVRTILRS